MSNFSKHRKEKLIEILQQAEAALHDLPETIEWTGYANEVMDALVEAMPVEIDVLKMQTISLTITCPEGTEDADYIINRIRDYLVDDLLEAREEDVTVTAGTPQCS